MSEIRVLDQITIDKIAAGEVVERPASVVKELVENALDAGASTVAVEIQDGGIALIRVTDDGCGISTDNVRRAFLRHSTSKIRSVEDLIHVHSLGFRGEALSSIAAVSKVEMRSRQRTDETGIRYVIEGGEEKLLEEVGAPVGTTFWVRQLFYNVPARRKFLKTAMTEAGHVNDLLMRLALSHPKTRFRFVNNGQEKLRTSGNGKIKDVIYNLYGRDVIANLIEVHLEQGQMRMDGFIGKPVISRGNRNFENYFINGRYIRSAMLSKAIEDAYKDFMMQHKFPFVVLYFTLPPEEIDVNVHPSKMDIRFHQQQQMYQFVYESIHKSLAKPELIPQVTPGEEAKPAENVYKDTRKQSETEALDEDYFIQKMQERVRAYHRQNDSAEVKQSSIFRPEIQTDRIRESIAYAKRKEEIPDEKFLAKEHSEDYKIIGQVFDTYWLIQFRDCLYIIDQHAAHERVLYEKTLRRMKSREYTSQLISPPIILSLTLREQELLETYQERFSKIGFEIEPFGGNAYAIRAVPDNLFSIAKKDLFLEMLDNLSDGIDSGMPADLIDEKIASMSCKAAVKGNQRLSLQEVHALIGELLELDNPYHCPHGRPTIISMSKRDLEKKFKRII